MGCTNQLITKGPHFAFVGGRTLERQRLLWMVGRWDRFDSGKNLGGHFLMMNCQEDQAVL